MKLRSVEGRLNKASMLVDQKKWAKALVIYTHLFNDYCTPAREFSSRANKLLLKRKFKAAAESSVIGGTIHPADLILKIQRTTTYLARLRWRKAMNVWRVKNHHSEGHIFIILARFECLQQLGNEMEAREVLISGHQLYPEDPKLNLVLGKHYFSKKQWDQVPFFL